MKLYPHQEEVISALRAANLQHQSVLLQAATGFGKTAVASYILRRVYENSRRAWFMCHRKELVEQTSKTLDRIGLPHGFISAGRSMNPLLNVQIASIDTLKNRLDILQPPNLLIVDEAHHSGAGGWTKVIDWCKNGGSKIIALTATPERLDGKGLDEHFATMVKGPTVAWLIENGFLSQYKAYAPSTPDMQGVKTKMGDFDQTAVQTIMDNNTLFGCAVENWSKHAAGKKTIGFAPSIAISEKLTASFNANGIVAAHLDANTDKAVRTKIIADFADGKINVLWNVNLFSEGFDLSAIAGKDVPIEAVILYRPTQSLAMHLQQVGRALRPKPYPAVILDHAGNLMRHGLPDMPFEWTLKGREKKRKSAEAEAAIKTKQCPQCYGVHFDADRCPHCGYEYPIPVGRQIDVQSGLLTEISKEDWLKRQQEEKREKAIELGQAKSMLDLQMIAIKRGYKPGWVWHIAKAKGIEK